MDKELFEEHQRQLAELCKALAHPARILIVEHLARQNSCTCGSLAGVLPLAQATISQHLKVLKDLGIIQGNIAGVQVKYCLVPAKYAQLRALGSMLPELACCGSACE